MRKNPERLAWLVLLISFALCGLTAYLVPTTARRFIDEHTSARPARLDIIHGTVLVKRVGAPGEQSARDAITLEPGDTVRTAGDARAILWFFDESNVELGPDSSVTLAESRSSTFSDRISVLSLNLTAGKPVVNVALPGTRERQFSVVTALGTLSLTEGTYELDLSKPEAGEAVVRVGKATVTNANASITCQTGQRAEMVASGPPRGPLSLARELVRNGDFSLPPTAEAQLAPFWKASERNTEGNLGHTEVVTTAEGSYLRFKREGTGHAEDYAVQVLERDVSLNRSLKLSVEARLVLQTLGGGGVAGTEYPLHVRIRYRNALGREGTYEAVFYYHNPQNYPTSAGPIVGQQRPHNTWFRFEKELTEIQPRPVSIIEVELAASGWDYETHVRRVSLLAE